jgi:hypothetical protein
MQTTLAFIVALLGVALSITNCSAVINTILDAIAASRALMNSPSPDPSLLSAVIGETIIAIVCHGLLAIVPAALLYAALAGFRLRQEWFYSCTRVAAVYFLYVPPFATIYGIILLVALRRRKAEFPPLTQAFPQPPENEIA